MISRHLHSVLIDTARTSIQEGLSENNAPWVPPHNGVDPQLLEPRGVFVTLLDQNGQLRGCIGSLKAVRPLIDDVAYNAHMAAFEDRRFSPLSPQEAGRLQIEISILSPLQQVYPRNESELFAILKVGVTGLFIRQGILGATFLPSVWKEISCKTDFFLALKKKAGIDTEMWSSEMEFFIYTVEKIHSDEK